MIGLGHLRYGEQDPKVLQHRVHRKANAGGPATSIELREGEERSGEETLLSDDRVGVFEIWKARPESFTVSGVLAAGRG